MKNTVVAAVFAASLVVPAIAGAATFDFTDPGASFFGDPLGPTASFSDTTNTSSLTAHAINTEQPPVPALRQYTDGIGVYLGGLDSGQVDNSGDDEAIVLDFGGLANFESISVSSASFFDDFSFYGSNNAAVLACGTTGLSCLTNISSLLLAGSGNGIDGDATFSLGGTFQYLIAAIAPSGTDGFRLSGASATVVPLPAALPFLAAALGGLMLVSRRRPSAA